MKNKGFTLIELMIVVAIIAILAAVFGGPRGCSLQTGSKSEAMNNMRDFAKEMGWNMVGGTCAETDSDGDGYISCTVSIQESEEAKDKPPVAKSLLCASGAMFSQTGGCKLAQGVYQQ